VALQIPVHVHIDGRTYAMETMDVSRSGIFMIARLRKIPCERQMQARIDLLTSKQDIGLSGRIVRIANGEAKAGGYLTGFAVQIDSVANDDRKAYEALVEEELTRAS
jgi:hypothetical protein